jgi:hypothetical protein
LGCSPHPQPGRGREWRLADPGKRDAR